MEENNGLKDTARWTNLQKLLWVLMRLLPNSISLLLESIWTTEIANWFKIIAIILHVKFCTVVEHS